jgi:hypothetical protein
MRSNKNKKAKDFFIVMFPTGEQVLLKCQSWSGLTPYLKYFSDEYNENTVAISITWWEAIKFILKGQVFDVSK